MYFDKMRVKKIVDSVDYAFQPIINIHNGQCYGVEALIRDYDKAGFKTITDFFDTAYEYKYLYTMELMLREKAFRKFRTIPFHENLKLFYNIDNRVLSMPNYKTGTTTEILKKNNLTMNNLCFEISERQDSANLHSFKEITGMYKSQGYRIAIDDFGAGFSGLQLLYNIDTDFLKIDRFFINNISKDPKKKLFVTTILKLAHILGIMVIAEGIETIDEFYTVKEIGCDFVQGYLVARPDTSVDKLKSRYEAMRKLAERDRRIGSDDQGIVLGQLEIIEPVVNGKHDINLVFKRLREDKTLTVIPVVDSNGEPLGIIDEKDLKLFGYSPYGHELLAKRRKSLSRFITKIPISEVSNGIEEHLNIFNLNRDSSGIIITDKGQYLGLLSARSLVNTINEKNLTIARDQNPLTGLPGNIQINEQLNRIVDKRIKHSTVVYFDFNSFKPFNDYYGYRTGDKAILLFANILQEFVMTTSAFAGHIGGDDFIVTFNGYFKDHDRCYEAVRDICRNFSDNAKGFYSDEEREKGYIVSKDREGNPAEYSLLTVSASILNIVSSNLLPEEISRKAAEMKKAAKDSPNYIICQEI